MGEKPPERSTSPFTSNPSNSRLRYSSIPAANVSEEHCRGGRGHYAEEEGHGGRQCPPVERQYKHQADPQAANGKGPGRKPSAPRKEYEKRQPKEEFGDHPTPRGIPKKRG